MQATDQPLTTRAFDWIGQPTGGSLLTNEEYCETRDVFQARLARFGNELERDPALAATASLLEAIVGELGNNSFDHNLGSWRDVPGVYFAHNREQRITVIADRGQGVFNSLKRVQPSLTTDQSAVELAFSTVISGRAPERRGNGLKFVASVIQKTGWSLEFYSGIGRILLGSHAHNEASNQNIQGVVVAVQF